MRRIIVLFVLACLLTPTIAYEQSPAASRYRVLFTRRISTLQAELAQAVNEGYRVVASARPTLAIRLLVLERSNEKHEYFISDTLTRDLRDQKVAPGYRLLPQTVGSTGNQACASAIFERSLGDSGRRDYRVASAVNAGNLHRDILNAAAEGYRALAIGATGFFCAVLEREPGVASPSAPAADVKERSKEKQVDLRAPDYSRPSVLIATSKTTTLEKELAEAATHGYRLRLGAAGDELVYLTERQDATPPRPDYVLLSTVKTATFEREMNQAAARGYRLHPFSLALSSGGDTVAVMEKRETPAVEYRVIDAGRVETFEKELNAASEQGWELVVALRSGVLWAVFQKSTG